MKEIDFTNAPRATPEDIARIWAQFWGDRKPMTDKRIFDLYDLRGELLDTAAEAAVNERPFYMGKELAEVDQQIRILESITPEAQAFYFGELLDSDYADLKATQEDARQ